MKEIEIRDINQSENSLKSLLMKSSDTVSLASMVTKETRHLSKFTFKKTQDEKNNLDPVFLRRMSSQ